MRFLLDQDVYAVTTRLLNDLGHDAIPAGTIGLSQATDIGLLVTSAEQGRILITRDRDFGALVFMRSLGAGVIYLRGRHSSLSAIHEELQRVLSSYSQEELFQGFVVVEPGRHRFRKVPKN